MIKKYLQIIKPGIILGNLISTAGGFFLATKENINYFSFFIVLIGVSLVIASGCVFNNYIDRDIDRKMERTKNRVLVKELISPKKSLIYAVILGIIGFSLLYLRVNLLAVWLAIIGYTIYIGIYSLYMKRKSVYGTLIGSISGAMPPIIGYCSVSNKFDIGTLILFFIFSLWQIPHFYAIAIFHLKDYQSVSIPVLPVKYGILVTKNYIIFCIIGFILATLALALTSYISYNCFIVIALISIYWLSIALYNYKLTNDKIWSRKIFIFSIIVISVLNAMMLLDLMIPSI